MSHVALPANPKAVSCTGQGCPERDECLRYLRPAFRASRRANGTVIVQLWASYDIEAALLASCPHKQAGGTAMSRAFVRAAA